ncbi:alpha/beta fold hydrolase, partial [Candidatus Woesearchaeota archaeon]|nr:alpha/beta fold hydrolase [Candidatus Woesearchaeota archaeon]
MKTFIENNNGEKICVLVEKNENSKGLVFVAHGLGGYKEQPHIRAFIEAFLEEEFCAVSFDARRGLGESEGTMEFADATSYIEDLEEVIDWAKKQTFYQEPFFMTGHSIGSLSIGLYAENYPEEVKAIAPIS